jgi:hypothetical protein
MIAADRCLMHATTACVLTCVLLAGCSRYPHGNNPYGTPAYGTGPYGSAPYGTTPPPFGTGPGGAVQTPNAAAPNSAAAPTTTPWGAPPGSLVPPSTNVPAPAPTGPTAVPNLPPPPRGGAAGRPFPSIGRPSWGAPGTIDEQQNRAVVHDPYPDNDAGPAIEGGRPRDFQKPLAQPVRANPLGNLRWPF